MNKTNASYRELGSGDAKNTDLFFDREHREFFGDVESVTVRLDKQNLAQAFLFIASMLPKKFDSSSIHENRSYSPGFVEAGLAKLDAVFNGNNYMDFTWSVRTDVPMKNGEIDERLYLNGLITNHQYTDKNGTIVPFKFTIRDFLLGGYSTVKLYKEDGSDLIKLFIINSSTPQFEDERPSSQSTQAESGSMSTAQKIYYGCPGTGKSHNVKKLTEGLDGEKAVYFDKDGHKIDRPEDEDVRFKTPCNVFRTTFHPDYDYATFVGTYKPQMVWKKNENGQDTHERELSYEFVPQVFTNAYVRAYKSLADDSLTGDEKNVYLIIEEINRGNCAQIFGDLFQLLDRKNGYSQYPLIPDTELGNYLASQGVPCEALRLPSNLHIYATMNTSDQSLFPMDSAFKRRWAMEYVPINYNHEEASSYKLNLYGEKYEWTEFLRRVNAKIRTATNSEDKQMGEFFIKSEVITEQDFINKVMFYIWNDVCKDLYSATRVQKQFFMRDSIDTCFTFAELFGGRRNKGGDYSTPEQLIRGFMAYLESEDEEKEANDTNSTGTDPLNEQN